MVDEVMRHCNSMWFTFSHSKSQLNNALKEIMNNKIRRVLLRLIRGTAERSYGVQYVKVEVIFLYDSKLN